MKVAVTGGSGVVGRAVVRHLIDAGHQVDALARSDSAEGAVAELGARPVRGDVLDLQSLRRLVTGAEYVFHVAGVNEMCIKDARPMFQVNVEGTRNVVTACVEESVGRLVHTSSGAAIGDRGGDHGDETTVHPGTYLSRYEHSKCVAEELVLKAAGQLDVVVVNPSSVQGPGRDTGSAKLILDVVRGRLKILADTEISFVDIDDCAQGHLLAALRGQRGQRYILSGATVEMSEAVAMLERALGRRLDVRYVPGWLVTAGAATLETVTRITGKRPLICREAARVILEGARYDGSKASQDLGLAYRPLEETMRRTVDWFQSEDLA